MGVTSSTILTKQPGEKRQYSIGFSPLMVTGETIEADDPAPAVISEYIGGGTSDLIITTVQISGQTVTFWIEDGTDKNRYRIEATITTSAGQILEGDAILKISDK